MINLYSGETGFFDDEELKLLDEMAMDLSYSMEFSTIKKLIPEGGGRGKKSARFPAENPNPVMRIDHNGRLLYANEVSFLWLQDWNLKIGQLVPQELQEVVFTTLSSGSIKVIDSEQGQKIISFFVAPLADAGYANLYGRNVTDRRHSEQALTISEQRYRSLFENMLEGYAYCQMIFVEDQPQDFIWMSILRLSN